MNFVETRLYGNFLKLQEYAENLKQEHDKLLSEYAELKEKTDQMQVKCDDLTAKGRKHIAPGNFAVPKEKKFPIHDISHARNALARASGTKYEAQVRSAVHRKYPSLSAKKP